MEKKKNQRKFFSEESPSPLQNGVFPACRLHVENFLTLKYLDIDIPKVTILIGPQAEGKSILAKLCYFFYEILSNCKFTSSTKMIKSTIRHTFQQYFPRTIWKNDTFLLNFTCDNYDISLKYNTKALSIVFNKIFDTDIKTYIKFNNTIIQEESQEKIRELYSSFINDLPSPFLINPIFIPALRQFYSQIRDNVFSVLEITDKGKFDPFVQKFGSTYELVKRINCSNDKIILNINENIQHILKGKYKFIQNKEYIVNSIDKEIPLSIASSGQQESLPLLLLMSLSGRNNRVFLEEPEAHLFPSTQKDIMYDLVKILNRNKWSSIFITTHSPYILSSLNNLIAAYDVLRKKNEQKVKEMEGILPRDTWLNFDDVKCFYLEDGNIQDIMDKDLRMIDYTKIDECSSSIINEMNKILAILNEDDDDSYM
ncbi:MAG TPA: ATP-binding protein [Candidatus Mailhella merdavium]|nr:ATP-binding protein [Candidatus Mailhella merdavium]